MQLPNADRVLVQREKIANYLLNAAHPDNNGKAEFFEGFGFREDDWETLAKALRLAAARGPYGGCVGYFSFSGNLDCCITIRTALIKDGRAYVQAGGGWVNDSTPEGEYQETVNKSKAMLKAVAMAESFSG